VPVRRFRLPVTTEVVNPPAAKKSALDRLLDAGVFAPLGYVLRRNEVRDDLAAAGRQQIAFARSLGRAALKNMNRGETTPAPPKPRTRPVEPEPVVEAVAGYGDMSAKQIAALLRSATPDQARWIMAEESSGKQRVTVLRPAAALLESDD